MAKAIECLYLDGTSPHGHASKVSGFQQNKNTPVTPGSEPAESAVALPPSNTNGGEASNIGHYSPNENTLATSDFINIDYNSYGSAIDLGEFWGDWQIDGETAPFPSPLSAALAREEAASAPVQRLQSLQTTLFSSSLPMPKQPTYYFGSLAQRPKIAPKMQRTANLIMQTLKSYPLMMLRHNVLPPFIHSQKMSFSNAESDNMEQLHNCLSLLHLLQGQVPGSRKLFWRNVRMECERFHQEVRAPRPLDEAESLNSLS
ncbi:hypothetical protein C7999DRAFT_27363 [Corynascus novoguineensis]|uniref:Uncharacterized protein n=1 Tax=Corynascus novoguineensis TaxID=1126955 RepID=A0AAN7HJ47_9PEZI|nr:hypothetical protein C7999DRAFT_27363 [Corynascus novoguineensis]